MAEGRVGCTLWPFSVRFLSSHARAEYKGKGMRYTRTSVHSATQSKQESVPSMCCGSKHYENTHTHTLAHITPPLQLWCAEGSLHPHRLPGANSQHTSLTRMRRNDAVARGRHRGGGGWIHVDSGGVER